MSEDEPLHKLMTMAQEKLRAGQSRNELMLELMQCGLDEKAAHAVLVAAEQANTPVWKIVLRKLSPLIIVAVLVYFLFKFVG